MPKILPRAVIEEIVRLRDEEGLTFEEIGKRLNLHPETCSRHYRRVKNEPEEKESHGSEILERVDRQAEDIKANVRACMEAIKTMLHPDNPLKEWCLAELEKRELYPKEWFLDKGTDPVKIVNLQKWLRENKISRKDILLARKVKELAEEKGLPPEEFCKRGMEAWEILNELNISISSLSVIHEVIKEAQQCGMDKNEFVRHVLKHKKLIFRIRELERQREELEMKREKYEKENENLEKKNSRLRELNAHLSQEAKKWVRLIPLLKNCALEAVIQSLEEFNSEELSKIGRALVLVQLRKMYGRNTASASFHG